MMNFKFSRLLAKNVESLAKRYFASESNQLALTFSSPYQVLYDKKNVKQVDVPSYSGSFGILANHVPVLAVIKPGVVTVFEEDGSANKFFVSSGTITVNEDSSVQVLAEEAVPVDWIDPAIAKDILSKAQTDFNTANTEQAKAEAQLAIELGEALIKANE